MKNFGCMWAVCYDVDGKHFYDGKKKTSITALFSYPFQAEEFIEKVLPAETKERFYVKQIQELDAET